MKIHALEWGGPSAWPAPSHSAEALRGGRQPSNQGKVTPPSHLRCLGVQASPGPDYLCLGQSLGSLGAVGPGCYHLMAVGTFISEGVAVN